MMTWHTDDPNIIQVIITLIGTYGVYKSQLGISFSTHDEEDGRILNLSSSFVSSPPFTWKSYQKAFER